MSSERTTAPRMPADPADPAARAQGRSIAGLIDVLDRAEGAGPVRRPQGRRSVGHRPPGARPGLVRTVPLRSVQPAPMARPAPAPRVVVLPEPERVPVTRLSDVFRRAAMWGAGPRGEHLAWRVAPHSAAPAARRPGRVRALVRRLALWGAGPEGEYLAWGGPARPAARRDVDPPVVLREMPSTPLVQPAAPSPAAVLLPRDPASSAGSRGMPPVPRGAVAVPGIRPGGPPERFRATGRPSPSRVPPTSTGLIRARGDPVSCPVRGSPLPAQRSRSPGSVRSSFP
ncbi:hypothetical protein FHU33_4982 [Blastococcus colisei]|uniref:Uncharacterized protein n=1 Tax=Blastococcus colisei TaxID=1564162 RepID=A0A543NU40_9ACTN|nr:hypothetical protein [Blastococcus colisei]TQN35358.1 hypothetical protein FHU33_4982 [Blastococcus colisei]